MSSYSEQFENHPISARDSEIIALAWDDDTSFEDIERRMGLCEADVIKLMRRLLKPKSFRNWRKRVSGRITKHRKKLDYDRRFDRAKSAP